MREQPTLSVIVPVYENESIEKIVKDIYTEIILKFRSLKLGKVEFIIAEDGSRDNTRKILESISPKYYFKLNVAASRRGYVLAVKELYKQANGKYIFLTDSDGEHYQRDFWRLWRRMNEDKLDIVVGYKTKRKPYYRRLMSKTNNYLIGLLFGIWLKDSNCGFRMIKHGAAKRIIPRLGRLTVSFNSEALIYAKNMGYRFGEVPVTHHKRKSVVFPLASMPNTICKNLIQLFKLKLLIEHNFQNNKRRDCINSR